ncbi:Zn-ribbon domain-containing OB-fold protein [Gordonia sp. DT30]|uniref:Zn-ribbon domain-containing OB-fold protein n=1 Tax=Gordonia sp. DT30 TaxID=3416546 RepID=UPI003CE6CE38
MGVSTHNPASSSGNGDAVPTFEPVPVALPVGPQDEVEAPHWEGLKNGELLIQHCANCGRWIWSPSWICPQCHEFDPPWQAVDPVGEVYTWTTTHHVFPASVEFTGRVPYTTAFVSIPSADNRRLMGIVVGDQEIEIGTPVRAWIQPASDLTGGWPVLRWRKVEGERP